MDNSARVIDFGVSCFAVVVEAMCVGEPRQEQCMDGISQVQDQVRTGLGFYGKRSS